jgi:hypothetical protein
MVRNVREGIVIRLVLFAETVLVFVIRSVRSLFKLYVPDKVAALAVPDNIDIVAPDPG